METSKAWALVFQWTDPQGMKGPVRFIYKYDGSDTSCALTSKESAISKLMGLAAEAKQNPLIVGIELSPDNTSYCTLYRTGEKRTTWVVQMLPL